MRKIKSYFWRIGLLFMVSACSSIAQSPTQIPTDTVIPFTPTIVATLTQTPSLTPSPVPTKTATPSPSYARVTDPAQDLQIQTVSLKGDVQNRNIANWVRTLPQYNSRITLYPSHTDFEVSELKSNGMTILSPNVIKDNGGVAWRYAAINQLMVTLLKINPSEFGLEGKNDAYIVVGIMEDHQGRKAVLQFIFGKGGIEWMQKGKYEGLNFWTPGQGMNLVDHLDYAFVDRFFISGKPQGPDDIRGLAKGKGFYESQGTTEEEIRELFARIASTDIFSDDDLNFLETHIFFAWPSSRPWSH